MSSMYPTASELFQVGRRAVVATPNTKINPAVADVPGSNVNINIGTGAIIGQEIVARGAAAMRGAFIDSSRGPQLDRVVFDRTGLLRFSATPSTWDLSLIRTIPGVPTPGTYPAGSRITSPDGVQFASNADAVFGNFDVRVDVSFTAIESGEAGNLPGSTLLSFVDQPFDSTLTVIPVYGGVGGTPVDAAGGTETETDIALIARTRGFFPTLRRGVLGAIEYAALQVPGVAVATATEIANPGTGYPAAFVQLVIGDRNGGSTTTMIQAVVDKLLEYRAGGIPVQVLGGTVTYLAVAWSIGILTGYDESLALSRVRAVTVALAQYLPPGPATGVLYRSALIAAAKTVPGIVLRDDSLVSPVADIVPASQTEMLRVLATAVTFA